MDLPGGQREQNRSYKWTGARWGWEWRHQVVGRQGVGREYRRHSWNREGYHLRGGVESQYSREFLESMKVILIRTPRKGGFGVSTGHLLQSDRQLVMEFGPIQSSCWPRGSSGNLQTTQADVKTKDCSLKTGSGISLTRATTHNSWNTEKSSWCQHEAFTLIF